MPHGKVYAFDEHKCRVEVNPKTDSITTEQGVHGLRYYEKKLQANVEGKWINVGGAGLTVTASVETGSIVTATRMDEDGESVVVTAESVDGKAVLELPMAGTYSVYAELNGIKSETVQVVCSGNYPASMRYIKLTVIVDAGSEITISDGKTTLNGTSTGSDMFYLPNTGTWTVNASLNEETTSDTISISEYKDYTLELAYVALDKYTWQQISQYSANGTLSSIASVGDGKTIKINGTVGNTTFNNLEIVVFILGFNHNSSIEGKNLTHFAIGKISNKLVALVDSNYGKSSSDGFIMKNNKWEYTYMRTTILGSDKAPENQSDNTLIAALPSDLQTVMKQMTKYTTDLGSYSDFMTQEYLPLLSEYEVFEMSYDGKREEQYDYFKSGNGTKAYKYNDTDTACKWLLRDYIYITDDGYFFVCVSEEGKRSSDRWNYSNGIIAIFAV